MFSICLKLMRKSRNKTGNESQLSTSSYRESNSQRNNLGYRPLVYSWGSELHSIICNRKQKGYKLPVPSLLHQRSPLTKEMRITTQRLEIVSLRDAWHDLTLSIKAFCLLVKSLGKNTCNIPSFSSKEVTHVWDPATFPKRERLKLLLL